MAEEMANKQFDDGGVVDCVCLDLCNAFDSVSYLLLLPKLKGCGAFQLS